jgi:hypothetical protein
LFKAFHVFAISKKNGLFSGVPEPGNIAIVEKQSELLTIGIQAHPSLSFHSLTPVCQITRPAFWLP